MQFHSIFNGTNINHGQSYPIFGFRWKNSIFKLSKDFIFKFGHLFKNSVISSCLYNANLIISSERWKLINKTLSAFVVLKFMFLNIYAIIITALWTLFNNQIKNVSDTFYIISFFTAITNVWMMLKYERALNWLSQFRWNDANYRVN